MEDITKVILDTELDLILVHKRSLKLAEMTGLSNSAQTSFATAASEVARNAIEKGKKNTLILSLDLNTKNNYIVACLVNEIAEEHLSGGLEYAKKLVDKFEVSKIGSQTSIELYYEISPHFKADINKIDEWRTIFRNEPAVSPYEEIKRQNEKLQELSNLLQKSEGEYKTLTNSLPLIIFTADVAGNLLFANEWLSVYTGKTVQQINTNGWKEIVHEKDFDIFSSILNAGAAKDATALKTQARLLNVANNEYNWHQLSVTPFKNEQGEINYWIGYLVDIHAQKIYEEALKDNAELKYAQKQLEENQVTLENYIDDLNKSNEELQQFAFVASHDLQEPVRKMLFYNDFISQEYATVIDEKGKGYLANMKSAGLRMRNLIQDLLLYSQINKEQAKLQKVDLNQVAKLALQDLELIIADKNATINIEPLPIVNGDERMFLQLFENIFSNSLKYSREDTAPIINITCQQTSSYYEISFTDNGIGFDEKYLPQMFTLFQRLHSREKYAGTGLGLAICVKIIELHEGKISARSKEGEGASFLISLPV